jgi:hypothetical protein
MNLYLPKRNINSRCKQRLINSKTDTKSLMDKVPRVFKGIAIENP